MFRKLTILLFALVLLSGASTARAYTNFNVGVSFGFHDALAPYGSWMQVPTYGQVWQPYGAAGFTPYTSGHWIYTSYGPTWQGTEPWAWAAYHYGQWVFNPQYGWVWVPGYTWSPGRVQWAYGPDYIAWSPYTPYGGGYGYGNGYGYGGYPYGGTNVSFWIGINRNDFGYGNYANYIVPRNTLRSMFARRVITVHPGTLQRVELERIIRRPVQVVPVREERVVADRHTTRLVVPATQSDRVMREITRAHNRTVPARANQNEVRRNTERGAHFVAPSNRPTNNTRTFEQRRENERTMTHQNTRTMTHQNTNERTRVRTNNSNDHNRQVEPRDAARRNEMIQRRNVERRDLPQYQNRPNVEQQRKNDHRSTEARSQHNNKNTSQKNSDSKKHTQKKPHDQQ
ncbi:MAG: hypothetical protein C5B54_01295 [Acidobacteria bacterium]|nr:MAG: hypothetical protein C5B54_01295 [Acidobacteriota bacterium]